MAISDGKIVWWKENNPIVKFKYSEKATKFCEIFTLLLTIIHTVKSKAKISQNVVAFSEYLCLHFSDRSCEVRDTQIEAWLLSIAFPLGNYFDTAFLITL